MGLGGIIIWDDPRPPVRLGISRPWRKKLFWLGVKNLLSSLRGAPASFLATPFSIRGGVPVRLGATAMFSNDPNAVEKNNSRLCEMIFISLQNPIRRSFISKMVIAVGFTLRSTGETDDDGSLRIVFFGNEIV